MANRANDHTVLFDRVQHSVIADAGGPNSLDSAKQWPAHRLRLDGDEGDRFQNRLANGRR
jgi:hypothetical protein